MQYYQTILRLRWSILQRLKLLHHNIRRFAVAEQVVRTQRMEAIGDRAVREPARVVEAYPHYQPWKMGDQVHGHQGAVSTTMAYNPTGPLAPH